MSLERADERPRPMVVTGTVVIAPAPDGFEVACLFCDFHRVVPSRDAASWAAWCHNRRRRKWGCRS